MAGRRFSGLVQVVSILGSACVGDEAVDVAEEEQPIGVEVLMIDTDSSWTYWNGGQDLGTAWRDPAWVPSPPPDGEAGTPMGYGEDGFLDYTFGYGPDPN